MSSRKNEVTRNPWGTGPPSTRTPARPTHAPSQHPPPMPPTLNLDGRHDYSMAPMATLAQGFGWGGEPGPSTSTMPPSPYYGGLLDPSASVLAGSSTWNLDQPLQPSGVEKNASFRGVSNMGKQPSPATSVPTKHKGIVRPSPSPELQCSHPGCGKTFKTEVELRKHKVRHDLPFGCSTCDRGFGSKSDLRRHQTTVHSRDTSHLVYCTEAGCSRRDRGFSRVDNLKTHMKNVHGLDVDADDPSPKGSPAPPARGPSRSAADEAGPRRAESEEVQAVRKEVRELRDKLDELYREREAEARNQRKREAENARLFGMLGRVASSGGAQAGGQEGSNGR